MSNSSESNCRPAFVKYFKDEKSMYIFALTYLEGQQRNKIIELTEDLYDDAKKAKKWYKKIAKLVHPDMNKDQQEDAEVAMKNLEDIYKIIKESFDDVEGEPENEQ